MAGAFPMQSTLEAVLDLATRAPSAGNSQPWRWLVDHRGLHLYADYSRATGAAPRDMLLSCGAVLDHCVVALAAAGWFPRVHRFPEPVEDGHVALFEIIEQPPRRVDAELSAAISGRRSDRRPFLGRRLPAGTLELLDARTARMGVEFGVVPKIRWSHRDDGDVGLHYRGAAPDPGADGAVLIVLGTGNDDEFAQLRAGEALSHLVLSAIAMGLASCPLTEPLHDPGNRLALACEVFDANAYPQALIRIGLPADDLAPPAPTARRPAHETTTWIRD
ncbi:nitroreductase family protein [Mycobacterium sp. Y57]|uniref:nitroreductase family protein n=1 Tax=Mycolicibacterium xanthum TaxID=2796469 RepID=UPI001C845B58|nr:nitroreductase family protein [Mycolicibacterium xanthum]MBX7434465.1 nitroreductase family protein [Mycolicibacterium xanthum]